GGGLAGRGGGGTGSDNAKHVPPVELQAALGAREQNGLGIVDWAGGGGVRRVEVRRNDAANLILFSGDDEAVSGVQELVKAFDQAPRQIALEARIVEVDTDRARDMGIDWSQISSSLQGAQSAEREHQVSEVNQPLPIGRRTIEQSEGEIREAANLSLTNALHLLESKGAARTRDVPRVITLNNRTASILDGERVTFATRANGYASIYVADTMDAGLKLEVTPSLVESGQMRLKVVAGLTQLEANFDNFRNATFLPLGGSPIKRGQIVENTIVARDGEPVLLGGFTRTVDVRSRQRFPVLGWFLPFLFSREVSQQSHHENLIALTPRIVDLETGPDAAQKKLLEGH